MTLPLVILVAFGSASSSCSSRTHVAAIRVDSSACSAFSNSPTELKTPLPA
jgi:hypothetical protein